MGKLKIIFLIVLVTQALGCTKEENTDFASIIAGTYTGIATYGGIGSATASTKLMKSSETVVDLIIVIGTTVVPLDGIEVSSLSNIVFNLSFVDASGSFTGTVQGDKLNWTLISGTDVVVFSGNR